MAEWEAQSALAIGLYTPHAAPMQWAFYTGDQFPEEYRGDAFVAMRGSWNRRPPSGYEVVRVRFESGRPVGFEPFLQGFLVDDGDEWGHLGRLCGIAQMPDGSMLLSDDTNGVVYRIAYTGARTGRPAPSRPTNVDGANPRITSVPPPSRPTDTPDRLATEVLEAPARLTVSSPAFEDGRPIPETFAAEGQNISPALSWSAGPAGTRSYVVMMEDPDVGQDPPFVHWLLYDVPADVTMLGEAVPTGPAPPKPQGAHQGPNEYGSLGYYGPRPPKADPPHEYHFQVFALDRTLDLPFGATRAELLGAMRGHVLAAGSVVGTFER